MTRLNLTAFVRDAIAEAMSAAKRMTRDEAIKKLRDAGGSTGSYRNYENAMVDSLVALGLLKLDEPESLTSQMRRHEFELRVMSGLE